MLHAAEDEGRMLPTCQTEDGHLPPAGTYANLQKVSNGWVMGWNQALKNTDLTAVRRRGRETAEAVGAGVQVSIVQAAK